MIDTFETAAKALADRNRIRILKLLEDGEVCVCHLTDVLELAPATVSKHLSLLKAAGLVKARRDGRWIHYRLAGKDDPAGAFLALLSRLEGDATVADDRRRLILATASCCS
ncbi:MAG TPA: metalloregulator ArsR/SmtB family transcription factor [Candidatus Sulfotelmatobacter sp.]|jgi:DNA-binding transcriptional ArsR family regulator|nr:metalloregulator ArsR/SmtB family transcription factor [Candidatus Sulfotelmatobacter sp.]